VGAQVRRKNVVGRRKKRSQYSSSSSRAKLLNYHASNRSDLMRGLTSCAIAIAILVFLLSLYTLSRRRTGLWGPSMRLTRTFSALRLR
jgi:hypothetical protein